MYCKGYNLTAFNQWLVDISTYTVPRQLILSELASALSDKFWSQYFDFGTAAPSVDYKAASCSKVRQETFQLDMSTGNAPSYTTSEIWKNGHRFLIEVSGTYQDADVPNVIGDAMYFHDTSTGTKTFSSLNFNQITLPTQSQVPFQTSHVYRFTVERVPGLADQAGIITRDNGSMATPNVTGILSFKITDLGEYTL